MRWYRNQPGLDTKIQGWSNLVSDSGGPCDVPSGGVIFDALIHELRHCITSPGSLLPLAANSRYKIAETNHIVDNIV
jgi:hypothetical protein